MRETGLLDIVEMKETVPVTQEYEIVLVRETLQGRPLATGLAERTRTAALSLPRSSTIQNVVALGRGIQLLVNRRSPGRGEPRRPRNAIKRYSKRY